MLLPSPSGGCLGQNDRLEDTLSKNAKAPSPVRGQRLGKRSEAVRKRLKDELGLSTESAVDRAALDQLAQDQGFRERLRAYRAATELLDRWRGEFGGPGQRPQLHLRDGRSLSIHTGHDEHVIPETHVAARKLDDGRFALDLQVAATGDDFLVLESLRVAREPEALVPLAALHLASPIAPLAGEVTRKGPSGAERLVWGDDGVQHTYVGDELLPNRTARFA
jgi:hypothetical protein